MRRFLKFFGISFFFLILFTVAQSFFARPVSAGCTVDYGPCSSTDQSCYSGCDANCGNPGGCCWADKCDYGSGSIAWGCATEGQAKTAVGGCGGGSGGCPNTSCYASWSTCGGGSNPAGCVAQAQRDCRGSGPCEGGHWCYRDQCQGSDRGSCTFDEIPYEGGLGTCSGYYCANNETCSSHQGNVTDCVYPCNLEDHSYNYCCNRSDPSSPIFNQSNGYCSGNPGSCQYNSCGVQSTSCSYCTASAPGAATLSTPTNGADNQPLTEILSWTAPSSWGQGCPSNTNTYKVFFGTTNPPPQTDTGYTNTSITKGNLTYSTTYYWRIQTNNRSADGPMSPVFSFRTRPPSFFQTFGGNIRAKAGVSNANIPTNRFISGR